MCMPPEGVPGLGGGTGIHILLDGADLALPLYALCTNPQPGTPCFVEVDGFSRGRDHLLQANGGPGTERDFLFFSVDEWAKGDPQNPQAPSVTTEGASGGQEASADVFKLVDGLFPGPIPPPNPSGEGPWGNIAVLDGDGKRSASGFQYPGCGLK